MTLANPIELDESVDKFDAGEIGLYPGIPFDRYLRLRLMSQSTLKTGRDSMRHMKYEIDHMGVEDPTDDMRMGSGLHAAFLEPALAREKIVLWSGPRRAGPDWEAFKEDHADKCILTKGHYANLTGMLESARSHPEVRKWAAQIEAIEVAAVGTIEGVKFKGRADALTADAVWDLKKISSTDARTIDRTIFDFGYHVQAAVYCKLFKRSRFFLAFVEGSAPYDVRVVELSETWLKIGHSEMVGLIQRYKESMRTKHWPCRSEVIEIVEPPDWVANAGGLADKITIGNEKAFGD